MFTGAISQRNAVAADRGFEDLGLSDATLAALGSIGFEHPTPIQADVIPPALEGRDVIGLAQTGSGKTAGFILPMLERFLEQRPHRGKRGKKAGARGLVLSPTREIALQTEAFLEKLLAGRPGGPGLSSVCLIGGARMGPQLDKLRRGPEIVVATPGRLLDHADRGTVDLSEIEVLVLDEADHMLDLGFMPQLWRVLDLIPEKRQTLLFSATMPQPVERLVSRLAEDPLRFDLTPVGRAAEGIEHRLYLVDPEDKKRCLMALVGEEEGSMLVFVRRKVDADWAARQIEIEGHPVQRMHSDRSQRQRVAALSGLRQGEHRILVATDIAARGLDIPIIEHIVNFDVPETVEDYIHRAGRTARGDAGGVVSTIATWMDKALIREIERTLGEPLPREEAPGVPAYEERSNRRSSTLRRRQRIRRKL